ncbi:mu-like prophage FluMu protein gp28 [Ylistrum balloti]|uniref:mu-like prophage FluMu protein gp28 n=1 Tax=Ylistrum balloti TaxID=509963 RepID=UPI002905ABBD|nr:mu-like prophage FluMu protein gp28 [Ylistrum balloti]
MEKSRRTGISWVDAAKATFVAMKNKTAGGMNCYYMAYNKDMTQQYIRDAVFWAGIYNAAVSNVSEYEEVWKDGDEDKSSHVFKVNFDSGHVVEALSGHARNLRSKQGRFCFDEAAFHDNPEEVIKAAMAFLMWGGCVAIISTHNGVDNPFNDLINDVKEGRKPYRLHRVTLDDAIDQGLCKRIFQVTGRDWSPKAQEAWRQEIIDFYGSGADEELFCIPSQSGGAALSRALIEARMQSAPVLRFSRPDDWKLLPEPVRRQEIQEWLALQVEPILARLSPRLDHYLGEDFGRTGDLTVLAIGEMRRDLVLTVPLIIELRTIPFRQQYQVIEFVLERLPRFVKAAFDARGNGSQIAEEAADQFDHNRVEQVMLTPKWYQENMPPFLARFSDATIELPQDSDILKDLRLLKTDKGVTSIPSDARFRGADGGLRHGDSAIALALLSYSTSLEIEVYEHHSLHQDSARDWMRPNHQDRSHRQVRRGKSGIGSLRGAY